MYYPEGMKARVSPVQSIEPHRILAPTRDLNREPLGPQSRVVTTILPLHTVYYRCTRYTTAAHGFISYGIRNYYKYFRPLSCEALAVSFLFEVNLVKNHFERNDNYNLNGDFKKTLVQVSMMSSNTTWMNLNCINEYGLFKNTASLAAIYMQLHVLISALYFENVLSLSRHNYYQGITYLSIYLRRTLLVYLVIRIRGTVHSREHNHPQHTGIGAGPVHIQLDHHSTEDRCKRFIQQRME